VAAAKKVILAEANKNEKEKRKRDKERNEKREELHDKTILEGRKVTTKKVQAEGVKATKKAKAKVAQVAKIQEKLNKRLELEEEKGKKLEKEIQARREKLMSEGVTPRILVDDISDVGDDDMDWESDLWEVVDHAVEWKTGKPNFKVITGMRMDLGGASDKWIWGQREALHSDNFKMSVLDKYIEEKCDHPIFQKSVPRAIRIKKTLPVEPEKAKMKKECDHSSFELGLSYHADPEVNPGWCAAGKFLFGVECAGCGSPFVQKMPEDRGGEDKKRGAPQVPSTTNAVYCCNNLRNRNGTCGEGCDHAYCRRCWDEGLLEASKSGVRASRRAR